MNELRNYSGYLSLIGFSILINFIILYKWITAVYDNNFAGGMVIPFLGFSIIILNSAFLISFFIAGFLNKKRRKVYFITAIAALIPIFILYVTG